MRAKVIRGYLHRLERPSGDLPCRIRSLSDLHERTFQFSWNKRGGVMSTQEEHTEFADKEREHDISSDKTASRHRLRGRYLGTCLGSRPS
jgi:hypothetical protein